VLSADTIVAIATAISPDQGSIAIVRMSGDLAVAIAQKIFQPLGKKKPLWQSHHAMYGFIMHPEHNQVIDECLVLPMLAPRSYTKEDVVEIHCHGGIIPVQAILNLCLAQGARLARSGEFTLRAFLNGRIDLTQAEAVQDLVQAKSLSSAQQALLDLRGNLRTTIEHLRQQCLALLAEIEAHIDFEDDLPPLDTNQIAQETANLLSHCQTILASSQQGQLLRDGLKIAIIGRPNVGKSSLLNAWTKTDRAIVTDLPGTTRDVVDSYLVVKGIPVQILDTAGIRHTNDVVEGMGIERAKQTAQNADVVLLVIDGAMGWQEEDRDIYAVVQHQKVILVVNKSDRLQDNLHLPVPHLPVVYTSALQGLGIAQLEEQILQTIGRGNFQRADQTYAINQRQQACLIKAVTALSQMQNTITAQLPLDFWTIDLRSAIHALGEITGAEISESLLDQIFSRFCIGK